ncbi:MAG: epimerase, partial [Pseudomonadota bacterium]|nr:epimerase [Pseudomonadota bacterium]
RCFSFIDDNVFCLKEMAFRSGICGQVFNIGPDEEFIEIIELAELIADLLSFKLNPIFMPDRPQEVRLATCSSNKARKLLGYETKISLREGLQSMIDYVRSQGASEFMYHLDLEIINESTPRTWKERLF